MLKEPWPELDAVLAELRHQCFWLGESQQSSGVTDISAQGPSHSGSPHYTGPALTTGGGPTGPFPQP